MRDAPWLATLISLALLALTPGCGKKAERVPDASPVPAPPPADVAPAPADTAPAPADTAPAPADAAPALAETAAPDAKPVPDVAPPAADAEPPPPPEAWRLSPPAVVPAATPTSGACMPRLDDFEGLVTRASDRTLELCQRGESSAKCWTLDLDSAALQASKKPSAGMSEIIAGKRAPFPKELRLAKKGRSAKACLGPCVELDLAGLVVGQAGVAAGRVFVAPSFDGETPDESRFVRVYDGKSGAELSKHSFADLESECPVVSWAGEVLYVEAGVCAGPGAVGLFFDAVTGKRVALLGGEAESASAWAVTPVPLASGRVAFREQYGRAIFFHDGKTGKLEARMNLVGTLVKDESGEPDLAPEEGAMFLVTRKDGGEELVVTQGGASRGRVVIVDPAAQRITRLIALTTCP